MSNFFNNVWKNFGVIKYRPNTYNIEPTGETNYIPMTLPGDRAWQGVQLYNPCSDMLQNNTGFIQADQVRNPYMTERIQTERINRTSGGPMNQGSIGPAIAGSFSSLFKRSRG